MVHNYDLINNTYESNGYISYSYIGNFLADLATRGQGVAPATARLSLRQQQRRAR